MKNQTIPWRTMRDSVTGGWWLYTYLCAEKSCPERHGEEVNRLAHQGRADDVEIR